MSLRCPQKQRYDTSAAALKAMRKIREKNPDREPMESRAYECPVCGGWHLTSHPKRGAAAA